MNDQSLRRLLRGLPGERAREGFTDRVLAALDGDGGLPASRPRWQPRLAIAAAALAATVASAGLIQLRQEMRQAEALRILRELRELRAEHQQIERELRSLSEPRIYLGGDESVDLVVDLSQVRNASY